MKKLMLILALSAGGMTAVPQSVSAECARDYTKCLNDTYDLGGILQKMADISCFASYVGCIRRSISAE